MIEKNITSFNQSTTAAFPLGRTGLRIVFMGTPEFAVASLDKLVNAGCNIVGVITAPDKAAGRGLQLQQSAVKQYALQNELNILQPEKLKNPQFLAELKSLQADLQIVVAFRMLPQLVWDMPPMGTVNVHGSLLPQYRGAAPINWAIINGEKETGVTTFKLKHEIDTGDILMSTIIPVGDNETAGELHDRMKEIGATLLLNTVNGLTAGNLKELPQATTIKAVPTAGLQPALKHAPKIVTETCQVNWNKPVQEVYNLVRGLSPYPTAFTFLGGRKLKLYQTEKITAAIGDDHSAVTPAGEFKTDQKTFLYFACADGYLSIKELQLEGKKKMAIADFLRGYRWQ